MDLGILELKINQSPDSSFSVPIIAVFQYSNWGEIPRFNTEECRKFLTQLRMLLGLAGHR